MHALKEPAPLKIDRNFEMPSVPIVLSKILRLVDDDSATARRLEELILHDPSLSARILKLANSAFYSFRCEVRTISHAIALLGLNLVKSLAIGVSIFESFTKGFRVEIEYISQLWMHSIGVGVIAQEIWTKRSNRAEGEFAVLCGLLHDLGKVVYFKNDAAGYGQLFAMERGENDPDISAVEFERYGVDHSALGSRIAKQWGLPAELATVIRQHHSAAPALPLAAAISVADILAKQTRLGYDGDSKRAADISNLLLTLKMSSHEFDALLVLTDAKRADVEAFFHLHS